MLKNVLLASFLTCSFLSAAQARNNLPNARILIGNNVMVAKSDNRVSGSIYDLQQSGAGEDQDLILACYQGDPSDVCELLKIAVKEENDKNEYSGKKELHIKCSLSKSGTFYSDIKSKSGDYIRIAEITECE